jgi:hypothetical protein
MGMKRNRLEEGAGRELHVRADLDHRRQAAPLRGVEAPVDTHFVHVVQEVVEHPEPALGFVGEHELVDGGIELVERLSQIGLVASGGRERPPPVDPAAGEARNEVLARNLAGIDALLAPVESGVDDLGVDVRIEAAENPGFVR